ncbi:unnamed protein product [Mortierella alpina]
MNHRTAELRIQPGTALHSRSHHQPQSKLTQGHHGHHGHPAKASRAEKAEQLLATVLVFYRDAMSNPLADSVPPPFFQELQAHVHSNPPLPFQFVSKGDSTLEQQSADIALGSDASRSGWSLVDYLFYTIVNLQRPQLSPRDAIERNAKAVFNVVVASIVEGAPVQDCERLLLLCIHLKDTQNCYPLRGLAGDICLDMARENSLPFFARTAILRFILGPADFIMHHLETRIRLTEDMTTLLREDSCEDLEFWTLVQRIARKIGLHRPTSALEQLKCRFYRYLDLVVADPRMYCTKERLTAYMSLPQWKSAVNQDLVLYLYIQDYKHQMLLFLETIRILGLKVSLFEPGDTQRALLENQDLENEAMIQLALAHRQICACANDREIHATEVFNQVQLSAHGQVERTLQLIFEHLEPTSEIQETLCDASSLIVKTIAASTGCAWGKVAEQLCDLGERLLSISAVVPVHLLQKTMWSAVLIQRVGQDLETICSQSHSPGHTSDPTKIRRITALCLDILQTCVVHRNEPRFSLQPPPLHAPPATLSSVDPVDQLRSDLNLSLTTFALLVPAHELLTWSCPSFKGASSPSFRPNMDCQERPPVCSAFLMQLFEHLVPLLERVTQKNDSASGTLVLAGSVLQLLSLQLPPEALLLERTALAKALWVCADLQRDSALSRSAPWLAMFDPEACPHPFPFLQSRLHSAAQACAPRNH